MAGGNFHLQHATFNPCQGKTMLMVTHDKALAERVGRKIQIIDGYVTRDEFIGTGNWAGS